MAAQDNKLHFLLGASSANRQGLKLEDSCRNLININQLKKSQGSWYSKTSSTLKNFEFGAKASWNSINNPLLLKSEFNFNHKLNSLDPPFINPGASME